MGRTTKDENRSEIFLDERWVKQAGRSGLAIFLAFFLIPLLTEDNAFLGPIVPAVQMFFVCFAVWSLAAALAGFVKEWNLTPPSERRAFMRSRNDLRLERATRRRD